MDNNDSFKTIDNIYKNLNYFDNYSTSIILFMVITLICIFISLFFYAKINSENIKRNWPTERCKPSVIPFAGFINTPDNMSFSDFTSQNFTFCTQNILSNITGEMLAPLTFVVTLLNSNVNIVKENINNARNMVDNVRVNMENITKDIMGRLVNIMIPIQQVVISVKDIFGKVQGTLLASVFAFLGAYFSLKSLLGVMVTVIVKTLIALIALTIVLWANPFAWGLAGTYTVFASLTTVATAIVLFFMVNILKVHPSITIPKVKCYDKNTTVVMNNREKKRIIDVQVGDILFNNNEVTAKIQVETKGSTMYNLNGVIVSNSHMVKHNNTWVLVSDHPQSIKLTDYNQPFLYCLNTTNKQIVINDTCFTDWDEIFDKSLLQIHNNRFCTITDNYDIHKFLDGGFHGNTPINLYDGTIKNIKDIIVDDVLSNGEVIYGVVEINGNNTEQFIYHIDKTIIVGGPNLIFKDNKSNKLTSTLEMTNTFKNNMHFKEDKLYHLLTSTNSFTVNNIKFNDYNSSIDFLL